MPRPDCPAVPQKIGGWDSTVPPFVPRVVPKGTRKPNGCNTIFALSHVPYSRTHTTPPSVPLGVCRGLGQRDTSIASLRTATPPPRVLYLSQHADSKRFTIDPLVSNQRLIEAKARIIIAIGNSCEVHLTLVLPEPRVHALTRGTGRKVEGIRRGPLGARRKYALVRVQTQFYAVAWPREKREGR